MTSPGPVMWCVHAVAQHLPRACLCCARSDWPTEKAMRACTLSVALALPKPSRALWR